MSRGPMNIGPYRLARLIKAGGQGTVYEAKDQRFGRKVAVKLMPLSRRKEVREEIVEEALILARFYHRSAVQILDVVETPTHLAVVMEYISGTDLQTLQEEADLSLAVFLHLSIELCSALSAIHRRGFVHRDLKPGNVLMDMEGVAQLTDFGIAVPIQLQALGKPKERERLDLAGSYYAMSPEHAAGDRVDQRSDIFAAGLILYRGLAGEHPFPWAGEADEFLGRLQNEPHRPLVDLRPELPKSLLQIVDKALAKDPDSRHYTAMEMRHELQGVVNELPRTERTMLAELVAENARPEGKGRPLLKKRPSGRFRSARSRLLSPKDWGPWGFSNKGLYRGMALSGVGLVIFMLLIQLAVNFLTQPDWKVHVLPTLVLADETTPAMPSSDQVASILSEIVDDMHGVRVTDRSPQDKLYSRLQCTTQLCQLQITLDRGDFMRTEYLALLPEAWPHSWRDAIETQLDDYYDRLPER